MKTLVLTCQKSEWFLVFRCPAMITLHHSNNNYKRYFAVLSSVKYFLLEAWLKNMLEKNSPNVAKLKFFIITRNQHQCKTSRLEHRTRSEPESQLADAENMTISWFITVRSKLSDRLLTSAQTCSPDMRSIFSFDLWNMWVSL